MKKEIMNRLPEISRIRSDKLRDQVIATWVEATEIGEWLPENLDLIPFTLLIDSCSVSLWEHTRAVVLTCLRIADTFNECYGQSLPFDRDILLAGALLHDVGKLLEYCWMDNRVVKSASGKLVRHPFSGVGLAMRHDLPPGVVHIIGGHSKEGDHGPRTVEGIIVNHADFVNFESLKA